MLTLPVYGRLSNHSGETVVRLILIVSRLLAQSFSGGRGGRAGGRSAGRQAGGREGSLRCQRLA
jgi:hypothetical protein